MGLFNCIVVGVRVIYAIANNVVVVSCRLTHFFESRIRVENAAREYAGKGLSLVAVPVVLPF